MQFVFFVVVFSLELYQLLYLYHSLCFTSCFNFRVFHSFYFFIKLVFMCFTLIFRIYPHCLISNHIAVLYG